MALRQILTEPNEILRQKSLPVEKVDKEIKTLMDEIPILGMSHITGGGIPENLPRCIPEGLTPVVDYSSWERPEIFNVIQKGAQCTEDDMKSTFNLGIGFCLIVPQEVDDLDENLIGEIHG